MFTSGSMSNSQSYNYLNNINKRNNDIFNTNCITKTENLNNLESPTYSFCRNFSELQSRVKILKF